MKPLSMRVLKLFGEMGEDRLDLHVLFEAAGNDPEERLRVLDAVDELVRAGDRKSTRLNSSHRH